MKFSVKEMLYLKKIALSITCQEVAGVFEGHTVYVVIFIIKSTNTVYSQIEM